MPKPKPDETTPDTNPHPDLPATPEPAAPDSPENALPFGVYRGTETPGTETRKPKTEN